MFGERHRPEQTLLYRLGQQRAASFIAHTEASTGSELPMFIQDEFDAFLECGILAHGFLRLRCGAGELKIIAAILERPVIEKILAQLGLDPPPPLKGRARETGPHVASQVVCAVGYLSLRATVTLQSGWRCALCRQAMASIRVNPAPSEARIAC